MDRNLARCRLAYRVIAKWTGGLRRAAERTRSAASYFFFLAATLRFAGAFFFAAVFAFVAFFTMLPS